MVKLKPKKVKQKASAETTCAVGHSAPGEFRNRNVGVRHVLAADLLPNPANWRGHPKAQQDALRGVLREVGFVGTLLAYELPDGRLQLIDGHLRQETMPGEHVDVMVVDLTPAEAAKVLATHDPLAGMAEADAGKLDALLREVQTGDEALAKMLSDLATDAGILDGLGGEAEAPDAEIDRAAELQAKWGTATGQLWIVPSKSGEGEYRVLCGDSTKAEDVGRLMGGRKPFIMVTDPPYGVKYDPEWRNEAAEKGLIAFAARREGSVENDDRVDWTDAYKLFPGRVAYVWHAGRFAADLVLNLRAAKFEIRTQIIWRKPAFAISRGHYHWQHEPCWYAVREGSSKWCGDRSQSTVWEISNRPDQKDNTNHGTQKPVECMARPIRNHGGNGDDVYDPFLGSGTTVAAAEALGRIAFGIEISPAYVAVILERLTAMGLEPRLEK